MTSVVVWFVLGFGFLALEMLMPLGVFIFIGAGCLAGALAAWCGADLAWQQLAAAAAAPVSAVLFRRKLRQVFSGRSIAGGSSSGECEMAGREGLAATDLKPGAEGQVEAGGSWWRAVLAEGEEEIAKGGRIVVKGSAPGDAMLLVVARPASMQKEA